MTVARTRCVTSFYITLKWPLCDILFASLRLGTSPRLGKNMYSLQISKTSIEDQNKLRRNINSEKKIKHQQRNHHIVNAEYKTNENRNDKQEPVTSMDIDPSV